MSVLSIFLFTVHFFLLAMLCLFGLHRLSMVLRWLYYKNSQPIALSEFKQLPKVTVQIPLYNEWFVAQRAVDTVAALDYPADKLQIQIVDDSTDNTRELIAARVAFYQQRGINIVHVVRSNREGFKAGALKDAMTTATGEFIAIFDADFTPEPSVILKTIHHFTEPNIGMVQFRWEHLNRFDSGLTETQAMMLDAHFSLEQKVRCASGMLFNFNGTAGIWRKETIIDAGNWSADTLTEDLDLSYRAQLRGWKMRYLNDISCAAELPADMNAFKSQQHRWAKGGVQVMKKMLLKVWKTDLPFNHKIEASFHLSNNLAYLLLLIDTLFFLVPTLYIRQQHHMVNMWWVDIPLLLLSSGGHLVYLYFGQVALGHSKINAFIKLPRLLLLGIQLTVNNARAGFEAICNQESEFIRTPKIGDVETNSYAPVEKIRSFYQAVKPRGTLIELLLAIIYAIVFIWAIHNAQWFMLPFLLLLFFGFVASAFESFFSQLQEQR
jgi:cellulose synthase/poly-beta-1,6-N-acetylglucosamine synthase-like glycosyltransferase